MKIRSSREVEERAMVFVVDGAEMKGTGHVLANLSI
jgi:hypothetical protein